MARDTAQAKKKTQRAGTPLNRDQVAQDTAHTDSTPSVRPGEQEPSSPGHRTRKATHRTGTPGNRNQVARDTAHVTQHTERAQR